MSNREIKGKSKREIYRKKEQEKNRERSKEREREENSVTRESGEGGERRRLVGSNGLEKKVSRRVTGKRTLKTMGAAADLY